MRIHVKIFRQKPAPGMFAINGIAPAPLTAEPDEAELAAAALLENMEKGSGNTKGAIKPENGTPEYYREASEKIRESRAAAARLAMRYIAYTEHQLSSPALTSEAADSGALATLENGLYKHLDVVNKEGGKLKSRWQNCLANVVVCKMRIFWKQESEGASVKSQN